jgi:hypothetical protein
VAVAVLVADKVAVMIGVLVPTGVGVVWGGRGKLGVLKFLEQAQGEKTRANNKYHFPK